MYGSIRRLRRNAQDPKKALVRMSKNLVYENPYSVTGTIKLTGSEQNPKGICKDKIIGTWKGTKEKGTEFLFVVKVVITISLINVDCRAA